jgi:hypothetical protein
VDENHTRGEMIFLRALELVGLGLFVWAGYVFSVWRPEETWGDRLPNHPILISIIATTTLLICVIARWLIVPPSSLAAKLELWALVFLAACYPLWFMWFLSRLV